MEQLKNESETELQNQSEIEMQNQSEAEMRDEKYMKEAIKQAVAILSARARFNGNAPILLSSRIAKEDKSFWYDLSNPLWQAVKITADGWNIEDNVPILFNRYRHQKPQVNPQKNRRGRL